MRLKFNVLKIILFIALLWFPLSGTDCNKLLDGSSTSIVGSWELVKMLGNTQDVCIGEIVDFQSSGNATLTCPDATPVQRTYTYSGDVLTYTENSLSYTVSFSEQNGIQKMELVGRNGVDRKLTYNKFTK